MARIEPSKEASLREVLGEVSLADVGVMLKGWLSAMGCVGIFMVVVLLIGAGSDAAGLKLPDWGIPTWVWWLIAAWMVAHNATSARSYHVFDMRWYFPKQGWFGSLLLAAYAVGFVYLLIWVYSMERGVESGLAFLAVYLGYTAPFTGFLAVTQHGHAKLMEKRHRDAEGALASS